MNQAQKTLRLCGEDFLHLSGLIFVLFFRTSTKDIVC